MPTRKQNGGKRPGAGRPRKPLAEKSVTVTITLGPDLWPTAKLVGGGGTTPAVNLPAIRAGVLAMVRTMVGKGA